MHHTTVSNKPILAAFFLALAIMLPHATTAQESCAQQVANIQTYCKKVDQFIKQNPRSKRIFANASPEAEQRSREWREFSGEGRRQKDDPGNNLNENAHVWLSQGKVVATSFTLQSASRDWVQYVMYYYREDGTLAKISSQLNTFYGDMKVVEEQFYDRTGLLLRASTQYCSLKTGKKKKPGEEFIPEPAPVYRRTDQLPFFGLVK